MKYHSVRDALLSLLMVGLLASPLALVQTAYATSHEVSPSEPPLPADIQRQNADIQRSQSNNAFGIGATAGIASCLVGPLLGLGASTGFTVAAPSALYAVVTVDFAQATLKGATVGKEGVLDCIAGALAKAVIRQLTRSLVTWINSGFKGAPLFITDFGQFLKNIADEQIGELIYGSPLAFLCSPFALQVKLTLQRSSFQRRVQCTLSRVVKNIDDFFRSFQNGGGWPAWLAITTEEQNNPYGATFQTIFEAEDRLTREQRNALLSQYNGFRSFSTCARVSQSGVCLRGVIVTPGKVISDQLGKALGSPWDQLNLVDEFNEIFDALLVALLTNVFGGGQGGLLGTTNTAYAGIASASFDGSTFSDAVDRADDVQTRALKDSVVVQLEETIRFEQKLIDTKRQSADEIVSAANRLNDLGNCYSQKLGTGSGSLTSEERLQAENRMSNARLAVQALLPRANALESQVATSTLNIQWLENYRTTVLEAKTQQEVSDLLNAFLTYRSQGRFSSAFAVGEAERELSSIRDEMRQLNQSTEEKLSECFAFPNQP